MKIRGLMKQTVGVGLPLLLVLLSGCEVARSARDDFVRLTSSQPAPSQVRKTTPAPPQVAVAPPARTAPSSSGSAFEPSVTGSGTASQTEATAAVASRNTPAVELTGVSESKLRALLGAPTSEEDHPPGKQWHYRDGKCTLDVQLYPDVQTKQFGTLAYKVKSDDNTDEGQRLCLAQLQSRLQARR
jgi:hypothetical protein